MSLVFSTPFSLLPKTLLFASVKIASIFVGLVILKWFLTLFIIAPYRSHLSKLPGPARRGIFGSHLPTLLDPHYSPRQHEAYREKYGLNLRVHGMGYFDERYLTFDPVAINYILGRAAEMFPKPWQSRRFIAHVLGEGLFVSEGTEHTRQRKIISPAFSAQALRALQPIFFDKAANLRDAVEQGVPKPTSDSVVMDLNNWLWRATFDIIGLAGFSYEFNSIKDETNETYIAYRDLFQVGITAGFTLKAIIEIWAPWISTIFPDDRSRKIKQSQDTIGRVGGEIIRKKKEIFLMEKDLGDNRAKDMLSLLIKANMAEVAVQNRLSDQEFLIQISTLLFVGSDTTSIALAWTFHHLSLNPSIQGKLRQEIISCIESDPAFDPLENSRVPSESVQQSLLSLPYLDYVIKEALRLVPPVHSTLRLAEEDCYVPTSDGTTVFMRKGQFVHVAVEAFNTRKDVWGPDAHEFNPERWANLPQAAKDGPGLVQGLMSFSLGPHSCPGYQFSMLEMKAILSTLIPAMEFEVSGEEIKMGNIMITRPYVKSDKERTTRLPIRIRRHTRP